MPPPRRLAMRHHGPPLPLAGWREREETMHRLRLTMEGASDGGAMGGEKGKGGGESDMRQGGASVRCEGKGEGASLGVGLGKSAAEEGVG